MDDNSAKPGDLSKLELAQRLLRKKGIHLPQRQSIPRRTEPGPWPLSFGQEGLWLLNQLDPDSPFYNIASAVRLTGRLNLIALSQSLNEIIRRHEVLRTICPAINGEPVQEVLPDFKLPLSIVNLHSLPESERDARLRRLAAEEARWVFNLARGPLVRATLLSLSEQEHIFLLTRHHIIFDGWSLGVFVRELVAIYEAFSNGRPSPLPELSLQFADFAVWQRQWLKGENFEAQLSYWRRQLADIPVLDLPLDKPRPPVQSFRGASQTILLSKDLSDALNALSLAGNRTLFMTLLAAFKVLLYKYTGQDDIAIGTRIAGRNSVETSNLMGYFVNALVLRTRLSGDPTFVELTERVSDMLLDAYAHQDMPFEKLVELLTPERDPSRQPFFNMTFALQNAPIPAMKLTSLTLQLLKGASETSKHDLDISITEEANGLTVLLEYNTDLFDSTTITRLLEHYRTLLQSIVLNPQQRLSQLSPLAFSEQHQLLVEWNDTQAAYPEQQTLAELFEAQAERTPDRIAYIHEGQYLSYGELNRKANQLAHYLRRQGVGPEISVGVCLKRSLESMVALLGVLKAGGAYVPVDVTHPVSEQEYIITEAQVKVVVAEEGWTEGVRVNGARVVCLEKEWEALAEESAVNPERAGGAEHISHIMYTSGSSGEPKGVVVEQRQLLNRFEWMWGAYPFAPAEVACQNTTIGFVVSLWEMLGPLLKGVPAVIIPDIVVKDPLRFIEILAEHSISRIVMVPSLLQAILDSGADLQCRLPNLKLWTTCGEPLSLELYQRFLDRVGHARLVNQYGASEVHDATYYNTEPQSDYLSSMPIGRPINNIQVYLLDSALQPVPTGVPGEIHIGSVSLARGYLNRPDLTAEKFIPNPISVDSGTRLYKTGDLARHLPDGRIECLGRRDHQVKIRGMRVELKHIEAVLGQHPTVGRSVVLARKMDDRSGEKQLVAYVVPEPGTQPTVAELQYHLKEKLPAHMLPSAYLLLDSLPLTPSGKVNRLALPAPGQARPKAEPLATALAPQSEIERTIANIWKEVLKLESVGLDDHFFDLGGHSLMMGQVKSKLQEAISIDVPMMDLFRYTTISELAAHLSSKTGGASHARPERNALTGATVRQQLGSDIAIVGMAGRFPGGKNINEFWRNLRDGVESSSFLSDDDLKAAGMDPAWFDEPRFVRRKPVLEDVELFDASFFGFTPREAEIMDPQHRFFLECAWEALESAGYAAEGYEHSVGVYAGASMSSYLLFNLFPNYRFNESGDSFQAVIANDKDYLATVASYKLNLKGPSLTVQTACSTSLVAIYLACQGLLDGDCDLALAGGVSISVPQKAGYFYQPEGTAAPDGHCRAFDAKAQGTVFGSGVGVVVLKRLQDALADGDRIEAIIKGAAINNDGSVKVGYIAPSIEGQTKVITKALEKAGVNPETVSYVETHGVATPLGDPIEIAALTEAFRMHTQRKGFCAIGSVKTNIGHLNAAAGVASLIKTVLMLKHKTVPPSLNFEEPNPRIDFINSPFFVNTKLTEWKADLTPRRAGISSFGVGGTNAHIILEEAPPAASSDSSSPWQLLLLSARTNEALEQSTDELADYLRRHPNESLADVAYTLQVGRRRFNHRRMMVCQDREDALRTLESRDPRRIWNSVQESKDRPIVFMFPGLGDQYVNMASDLYRHEPLFREQVDYCCERLKSHLNDDLRAVCYPAGDAAVEEKPEQSIPAAHSQLINLREMLNPTRRNNDEAALKLNRTIFAQPALFVIEYALARLLMEWGIRPQAMIGHSLGEYTAACLAEVMSLDDALLLVAGRARMIEQLPQGAMLAVPLSEDELRPLLGEDLWLAAINGPSLCVVAGAAEPVTKLQRRLIENGVAARHLQASHAFHSGMMEAIVEPFTQLVRSIKLNAPRIPFVSNVTGDFITAAEATDPDYWAEHMCRPVRFSEGIDALWRTSDKLLVEVGPGQTLCSFARQHPESGPERIVLASLRHPYEQQSDRAFMLNTLGSLWLAGVRIDWSAFHQKERRRRLALPTYPFERRRYWIEAQPQTSGAQTQLIPKDKKRDADNQLYIPIWKQSLLPVEDEPDTLLSQRWLIFVDETGVGSRVVERLEQAGHDVITVMAGKQFGRLSDRKLYINPAQREDYDALLEELKALDQIPQKIAHLWSVGPTHFSSTGLCSVEALQKEGFPSLLFLAQALKCQNLAGPFDIAVISSNMQAVIGRRGMSPSKAPVLGLCKVIPLEYENVTCRSIDIAIHEPELWRSEELIERLVKEMTGKSSDSPVAYSEDHRWVQKFEPISRNGSSERTTRLREGGVYLITNGLEGIGFELAKYLARNARAKLVLVDHTPAVDDAEPVLMSDSEDFNSSSRSSAQGARVNIELEEWADSITQLEEKAEKELHIKGLKDYQGVEDIANRLCTSYLCSYLEASNIGLSKGKIYSKEELREKLRILPKFGKFYDLIIKFLSEDEIVKVTGNTIEILKQKEELQDQRRLRDEFEKKYPEFSSLLHLLEHCVSNYPKALSGEIEAISVLYPEGRSELIENFYSSMEQYRYDRVYQTILQELVAGILRASGNKRIRILEVGAGNGILTESLLPHLKGHNVEYYFTDIGKVFVLAAEKKAAKAGLNFMKFGVLDISRDPLEQGYKEHSFDLILGFDVVHATRSIEETLGNLKKLLAPNGLLGLIEAVSIHRWSSMMWGLIPGWWSFEDVALRTDSPLLSHAKWEEVFRKQEFKTVKVYPQGARKRDEAGYGFILAQEPSEALTQRASDNDLTFNEEALRTPDKMQRIAELEDSGASVLAFSADLSRTGQMQSVITQAFAQFGKTDGVIHTADVSDGRDIQHQTLEMIEREFAPTVSGAMVLDTLFKDVKLDFFALVSAGLPVTGSRGRMAYYAASAFLDAFAQSRKPAQGTFTVSVNWDAPQDGYAMLNDRAMSEPTQSENVEGAAHSDDNVGSFGRLLAITYPQVVVSSQDLEAGFEFKTDSATGIWPQQPDEALTYEPSHPRPLLAKDYVAPRNEIERKIAAIWQALLGIEQLGVHDNFIELGGDSLIAVQMLSRLKNVFSVEISLRTLFESPTIAELAVVVVMAQAQQSDQESLLQMLSELEQLPEGTAKTEGLF